MLLRFESIDSLRVGEAIESRSEIDDDAIDPERERGLAGDLPSLMIESERVIDDRTGEVPMGKD